MPSATGRRVAGGEYPQIPAWFVTSLKWLVITTFGLICLGGSVRLMNAGLACPDWPLCFGRFIPDYHPQVYFEFLHRCLAGLVGIATIALQLHLVFRIPQAKRPLKYLALSSILLLIVQAVFGGLTVTMKLLPPVVATHLGLGNLFFATLLWTYLSVLQLDSRAERVWPVWLKVWCLFFCFAVYGQIILGGFMASNAASLACVDWPKCRGEWWPSEMIGPVALHMFHRLGGYTILVLGLVNGFLIEKYSGSDRLKWLARYVYMAIAVQIALGITNIMLLVPAVVGVLHLGGAAFLFHLAIRQLRIVTTPAPE